MRYRAHLVAANVVTLTIVLACGDDRPARHAGVEATGGQARGDAGSEAAVVVDAADASSEVAEPDASDAAPEADAPNCFEITAPWFRSSYADAIRAVIAPNLVGSAADNVWLEFWNTTPAEGTYDLAGVNANYSTCTHCVTARVDETRTGAAKSYMATSGTLTLTAGTAATWEFAGRLDRVTLIEATFDPMTSESKPVAGGTCLQLGSAVFDTVKPVGSECRVAQDCGDLSQKVCDPTTKQCALSECIPGERGSCSRNEVCVRQTSLSLNVDSLETAGLCYRTCTPFGSGGTSCGAGEDCVIPLGDSTFTTGICQDRGANADGAGCDPFLTQLDTGCVAGDICVPEARDYLCRQQCNVLASSPLCPPNQSCQYATHACQP
jgi:hypothetical protein